MRPVVVSVALGSFAVSLGAQAPEVSTPMQVTLPAPKPAERILVAGLDLPQFPPAPHIPTPGEVLEGAKKAGEGVVKGVEQLGNATVTTLQNGVKTLTTAGGDTVSTVQKAGGDTVNTFVKAGNDATATYVKGWRDASEQAKTSFKDTVDAGSAAVNFSINQLKSWDTAAKNAERRVRDGKVIDAMWGLSTEPVQASEANFYTATQQSTLVATAAQSAAAVYGGPGGAAAYAAWSTYRATGNADMAFRAGVLAAATTQAGGAVAKMPSGTMGEVVKKAAMAGAAGGIAVAAAGGDENAVKDGFLKSAGAVLIQASSDKAKAYSPKAKDAWDTVQCISAKDVDCLSKTTWARDAKGALLKDANGKPRFDTTKLDPKQYIGKWSTVDPNAPAGKLAKIYGDISKIPKTEAIPVLGSQWVLTWSIDKSPTIAYGQPTVVMTYVGPNHPFISSVTYGKGEKAPAWVAGKPAAASAENTQPQWTCHLAGLTRTVTVTRHGAVCEAIYARAIGGRQIVWHSDHMPEICATKAAEFVAKTLAPQGIKCSR